MLSQQNELDNLIRQSFGFSDEQLVEELNRAEEETASFSKEKLIAPKYEFNLILSRMEKERYQKKVIQFRRLAKAAAIAVILLAGFSIWGMPVVAWLKFNFFSSSRYGNESQVVLDNSRNNIISQVNNEEIAYVEINKQLGIAPLQLFYIPEGMKFTKLDIRSSSATILFQYNDYNIWVSQMIQTKEHSRYEISDRIIYKVVFNKFLQRDLMITRNQLDEETAEYGVVFSTDDARYVVTGIMEEEEFEQLVTNLFIVTKDKK